MKMKIMITWCIVLSVIIFNITGCKENQYEMDYDISGSMKDDQYLMILTQNFIRDIFLIQI